jgi:hypothetical protein
MIKHYFHSEHKYWIETKDYDYTKFKVGSEIICVNDSVVCYASFLRFGQITKITEILPSDLLNMSHGSYIGFYKDGNIQYKGTIRFDQDHIYSSGVILTQNHRDWMQRFILLSDWLNYQRKNKLERILY